MAIKKGILFCILLLAIFNNASMAQSGTDALKQSIREFRLYKIDPPSKTESFIKAFELLVPALSVQSVAGTYEAQIHKAQMLQAYFSSRVNSIKARSGIGYHERVNKVFADPASEAVKSCGLALELHTKIYQKNEIVSIIKQFHTDFSSLAVDGYETKAFKSVFQLLAATLKLDEMLKTAGEQSAFTSSELMEETRFLAGLSALNAGLFAEARTMVLPLYRAGKAKASVYELLYEVESRISNKEAAFKYLQEGRAKLPEETSLLFAQINHRLAANQYEPLVKDLKDAITAEPGNVSLYTTLGSVYEVLYQRSREAGNHSRAEEYFNNALLYFNKALEKQPDNTDALYSAGTLFYNKAAVISKQMSASDTNDSFDKLEKEMRAMFEKALPYFRKNESNQPDDVNTLIALKEIYGRLGQFELASEFDRRLKNVQSGKKNARPYFSN